MAENAAPREEETSTLGLVLAIVVWSAIGVAALAVFVPMLLVAGTMLVVDPVSWVVVVASLLVAWGFAVISTQDDRRRAVIALTITVGLSTVGLCIWFLNALSGLSD